MHVFGGHLVKRLITPIFLISIMMAFLAHGSALSRHEKINKKQQVIIGQDTKTKGQTTLKSFREWKDERIQESAVKLNVTKAQFNIQRNIKPVAAKTEATIGGDISLIKLENQMRLDLISLELAKDLTVADYFVGYVSKIHDRKNSMNEIAGKMSTEEVAEMMNAYVQSIFGFADGESPKTATNQETDK